MAEYTHTLVATLGGQPQVVTFTLDLLLRREYPIKEVFVLHPYALKPKLQHSLTCLNAQFVSDHYHFEGRTLTCHFRSKTLELDQEPLADITDTTSAKGTRETIYQFIQELKQQPRHIHLSVTGGRRLMALLAIAAAQLEFDPFDHIWHIYTPDEILAQVREGRQMHVPPEAGVHLLEMPFMSLGDFPLASMPAANTAQAVQHARQAQIEAELHARCKEVAIALTRRQHDVLHAFARGLTPDEVAASLVIAPSTVSSHTGKIFDLCRNAWNLPGAYPINYHFLRDRFSRYFDTGE